MYSNLFFIINLKKAFLVFLAITSVFASDGVIEATNHSNRLLSVGHLKFKPLKGVKKSLPEPVATIIANDLYYNGQSKLVRFNNDLQTTRLGMKKNGVSSYVTGVFSFKKTRINITCMLKDITTKKNIWKKSYQTTVKKLRQTAHKCSDDIVKILFGNKGFAQSKITFVSNQSGHKEVYIADYDGRNVEQVTRNQSINLIPTWGKENDYIIYTSYQTQRPQLFSYQLSKKEHKLYRKSDYLNLSPDYNPLDNELIYASSIRGNTEIFRSYWGSPSQTRLTFIRSIETSPSWSPNGYEFAFTSNRTGSPQIYIMDRDGSNMRRLSFENAYNTSPSWSPSGELITFVGLSNQKTNIYTIQTNGKNLQTTNQK